jgi:hypothetical protein
MNYLVLLKASQRNVLEITVDIGTSYEGMMISFDDEVKFDVIVVGDEGFERGRDEGLPDA